MEHRFAQIASNFTDNLDMMRFSLYSFCSVQTLASKISSFTSIDWVQKILTQSVWRSVLGRFPIPLRLLYYRWCRWQIQSMERREITTILLSFLCMILSAMLHLLASCLPRRNPTRGVLAERKSSEVKEVVLDSTLGGIDSKLDNLSLSKVCRCSSSVILYLACALTILLLSV